MKVEGKNAEHSFKGDKNCAKSKLIFVLRKKGPTSPPLSPVRSHDQDRHAWRVLTLLMAG